MDFNLNSFSSNLMLIALVLVGLCCLYLLYSNFTKVREIDELKRRVEDLKKIFLNQQIHNDETFSKINTVLFQTLTSGQSGGVSPISITGENLELQDINTEIAREVSEELKQNIVSPQITKTINLNTETGNNLEGNSGTKNIIINKEGHSSENKSSLLENASGVNNIDENKEINIDLHDLDNLDDVNDATPSINSDMNMDELDLDENCEEIDADKLVSSKSNSRNDNNDELQITKDDLFNIDAINITNTEVFDDLEDTLSIATAPIDETNNIINHNSNFNLDDIQDIQDIDDIDYLETVDIKSIQLNSTTDNIDLSELLNGNTNQTKKSDSNQTDKNKNDNIDNIDNTDNNDNIKTIDIDAPKTDYNSMSAKQLKDIAKSHGLKTTGTKQELVQILLAHDAKNN